MLHSELRFAGFQRTTEMERGPVRPERRLHVVENVRRMRRSPFPSLLRGFLFLDHMGQDYERNWKKLKKRRASQFWDPHMWLQQTAWFAAFTCTKHFRIRSHPENFKFVARTADENEIPASARLFYCVAWSHVLFCLLHITHKNWVWWLEIAIFNSSSI